MTVPKQAAINGSAKVGPIQPTAASFPSGECIASITTTPQTTQADSQKALSINSPAAFVDVLAGTGVTNVKLLVMRVRAGTATLRITSPGGVDQQFTLSDLLVLNNPVDASAWTALAIQGVVDVEMTIAGT